MEDKQDLQRKLGIWTATFAVFAGMIGSGIFGNTGYIQKFVGQPGVVLFMWLFYGLAALAGALSYAELASRMPHPGGEYVYLRRIFGPLPSFLTGWVSFIVGFAAPAAYSSLVAADYALDLFKIIAPDSAFTAFLGSYWGHKIYASSLILMLTLVHIVGTQAGAIFQNLLTALKLAIILFFIISGFAAAFLGEGPASDTRASEVFTSGQVDWWGIAPGFLMVLYAYSGWNGASYLAGEIKNPERNVPRALFWGTSLTILLYMLMNLLYYMAIPVERLAGEGAPASVAAAYLFQNMAGVGGFRIDVLYKTAFCVILLSSISAQIMIGPRVYYAMARDGLFFDVVGRINPRTGTPLISILIQSVVSIVYVVSATALDVLIYMGFALSIFPILTMWGLMKVRREGRDKAPYESPLYPILPLFFMAVSILTMLFSLINQFWTCVSAMGVVVLGVGVYFLWKRPNSRRPA